MIYRIYLIIFIIIFLCPDKLIAQEKGYRIEILVLTHLRHEAEPLKTDWLRDFSDALDFLTPPEPEPEDEEPEPSPAILNPDEVTLAEAGDLPVGELAPEAPFAEVVPIEDKGEAMQEAWRRLRLSAPFRPEQYLSWVQSADEPFPSLRLHDGEVILIDDPYAERRAELAAIAAEEADQPTVFSDQGNTLPGDPEQEPELPEPTIFHRIDGTVMLKRSRFLHLVLDLELREAVYDEGAITLAMIASEELATQTGESQEFVIPPPSSFLVHSLKQSRQVKSRRLEYFDGPVLSVLAYISPVELEPSEDQAPGQED